MMNAFGFFNLTGKRVPVCARSHLGLPYVQEALAQAAAAPAAWLTCCCGGGRIRPFLVAGFPHPVWDVRRESVSDRHAVGCFAGDLGAFFDRPAITYSSGTFEVPLPPGATAAVATEQSGKRRVRYGSYTHFCYSLFGRASIRAFLASNRERSYQNHDLRPFSVDDIDNAIDGCLAATTLSLGQYLLPTLESQGCELAWGVTSAALGEKLNTARDRKSDLRLLLHNVKSSSGKVYPEIWVRIPQAVVASTGGRRTGFKNLIPPPYWFMLTVSSAPRREGGITVYAAARAVVFPIVAESWHYAVESEFERAVLLELLGQGFALLKPATRYALGELGPEFWPFGLLANGRLPHRVDLILYTKGHCVLTELAGIDGDDEYLQAVEVRLKKMKSTADHGDVRTHTVLRRSFLAWMKRQQALRDRH